MGRSKHSLTRQIFCVSDWTAVEGGVKIPFDLEAIPLQIKTDSVFGSSEKIIVRMFGKYNSSIGGVRVKFSSTIKYFISECMTSYPDLPVQPPGEVDKIWTITKTETAIIITCNNVEVLHHLFTDSSNSNCVPRWGGDVVEEIEFSTGDDTASDFYRAVHCPAFSVDGSAQGNWTASPTGTTATIECAANHILVGSATLNCQENGTWSSDIPLCDKIGKLIELNI
eukprot:sb/3469665/